MEELPSARLNELERGESEEVLFRSEIDSALRWLRSCSAADSCEACSLPVRGWTAD